MFFSFDGIDGAGKTTQIGLFAAWLRGRGREVVVCRDPGGTSLGERVREMLLHAGDLSISRRSEMLLYMASRAQLVEEVIRPALDAGKTVISDRFLLANVVYQGYAGGLDVAEVWEVGRVATAGVEPDLTFLLDLPEEAAAARMNRELDRMESQGADFRQRLRNGFLAEARRRPEKIAVIDASRDAETIAAEIQETAENLIRE